MSAPRPAAVHDLDSLIAPECREVMRREIAANGGAEVLFVGRIGPSLRVEEAEAYAYGNRRAVPAIMQHARAGDVVIHNHPSGNLEPSGADIEIASILGERSVGSYIVNNDVTAVRLVVKAMRVEGPSVLDPEEMAGLVKPGGLLSRRVEGFEFRPSQERMLRTMARALNEDAEAVVEAGTGTGKSMAYLIPAIHWSVRNNERIAVSTFTINLQEQLLEKDIPALKQALGIEFEAVLLKGRSNYLSRRRAEHAAASGTFLETEEKRTQFDAILAWAKISRDGSLSDLGFNPDSDVWDLVMSEADNCLRTQCPTYQTCFFYQARRRAAKANLLLVNHHLLLADLAVRAESDNYTQSAVLPPFQRLVLDEAHHLEEVATAYFGSRVSTFSLEFQLRRLASRRTGGGVLRGLSEAIGEGIYKLPFDRAFDLQKIVVTTLADAHRELREALEETGDRIAMALDERQGGAIDQAAEIKVRLTPAVQTESFWLREAEPGLRAILTAGRALLEPMRDLLKELMDAVDEESPKTMSPLLDLRSSILKIEAHLTQIVRFLGEDPADCRWIEYRRRAGGRRPALAFCAAPLGVDSSIRESILRRFRTVAMTSATLTVGESFDFFLGRIGADDPARLALIHPSSGDAPRPPGPPGPRALFAETLPTPFDYDRQAYAAVPLDLPSPKEGAAFARGLEAFLKEAIVSSRGRALVLFTSFSLLRETFDRVAPFLEAKGYPCLRQGGTGRTLLAESFRRDIGSVLFATSSFWEGVDIPGEALSCLVLTRLPFSAPGEPVVEARVEAIKESGGDPFTELIVPNAVIKFRQGFGRLIRTRTDRGAVLICDRRAASAGYGRTFIRSLPVSKVHMAPAKEIQKKLAEFFGE